MAGPLRVGWGCLLVVLPRQLLRVLEVKRNPRVVLAARVLGARHLLEGAVMVAEHKRLPPNWIRATDALHALSMLGLAVRCPRLRRVALMSAAGAVSLLVGGAFGR